MGKKKDEVEKKRTTIVFSAREDAEMHRLVKGGDFRSKPEVVRHALRRFLEDDREQRESRVRGLALSLDAGSIKIEPETLKKIKKLLESE